MIFLAIACPLVLLFTVADSVSPTPTNEALLSFHIGSTPKTPEVHLENFSDMTATVQFYINETSTEKRDENIIVNAPKNYGIMAFVKVLHFRLWKNPNATLKQGLPSVECRDYLKFKTSVDPQNGEYPPICGDVDENDHNLIPYRLFGPRIFREPTGKVNLFVHTFYHSFLPKTQIAEVVFTAFLDCWRSEGQKLTRCSKNDSFSCISNNLACDGTLHCAFPDGFGTDEQGDCIADRNSITILEENEEVELIEKPEDSEYQRFNSRYLIPTGLILFIIWGIITMIRKCYKCYKDEKEKEELYY